MFLGTQCSVPVEASWAKAGSSLRRPGPRLATVRGIPSRVCLSLLLIHLRIFLTNPALPLLPSLTTQSLYLMYLLHFYY
jgi:hypothetical protein